MFKPRAIKAKKLKWDEKFEYVEEKKELDAEWASRKTYSDCVGKERPCLLLRCKFNILIDVRKSGNIHMLFDPEHPEDVKDSCCIDVANEIHDNISIGDNSLERVGMAIHVTRERVRQMEEKALEKLRAFDFEMFE